MSTCAVTKTARDAAVKALRAAQAAMAEAGRAPTAAKKATLMKAALKEVENALKKMQPAKRARAQSGGYAELDANAASTAEYNVVAGKSAGQVDMGTAIVSQGDALKHNDPFSAAAGYRLEVGGPAPFSAGSQISSISIASLPEEAGKMILPQIGGRRRPAKKASKGAARR
jgi:hypothetical protein